MLPSSNVNAFPSLGERTRVALLFCPASGKLAAELPHPSMPHLTPQPVVDVWQERCWSEAVALSVMETSWGPLHLDAVDKSRRVGIGCFGEPLTLALALALALALTLNLTLTLTLTPTLTLTLTPTLTLTLTRGGGCRRATAASQ